MGTTTRRTVSFTGLAALALASILIVTSRADADISEGSRPVFVPISPCRLADTRPAPDTVGPRSTPIGAEETIVLTAHGENGDCDLPTDAVGLSMNVTALGATLQSFLTIWPDGTRPTAASLNPSPGQPPIPNAVNVALSDTGTFSIYNNAGTVHTVIDVNGYYASHDHDDRYYTQDETDAAIAGATGGPGIDAYTKAEADALFTTDSEVDTIVAATSYSKTEADDRFYEGANVVIVPADGTPAENGAAFEAALAAISDASAENPYLVRLGAGVFDVGSDGTTMVGHVSVAGAGRRATIITAPGTATDDEATVVMASDMVLREVLVRSTGGSGTNATGVIGFGNDWRIEAARVEVIANGATVASGFNGINVSPSPSVDFYGVLHDVEIEITEGTGATFASGVGSPFAVTGDMGGLRIEESSIVLRVAGTGMENFGAASGSTEPDELIVRNTVIRLEAGGTGVESTAFDRQLFDGVEVIIDGGSTSYGFRGAGSGFTPDIRNSRIDVDGSPGYGVYASNLGFVRVRGTTIDASVGIYLGDWSSSSLTVEVDDSDIDASTAFEIEQQAGGTTNLRVATTKLDATTNVDQSGVTGGTINIDCIHNHDETYALALDALCA